MQASWVSLLSAAAVRSVSCPPSPSFWRWAGFLTSLFSYPVLITINLVPVDATPRHYQQQSTWTPVLTPFTCQMHRMKQGSERKVQVLVLLLQQHLYPYPPFLPQVGRGPWPSAASCFLPALVFYANKEERQPWGLLLLICPRGSLDVRINLQISRPVLLAWAVIANLFLLDGRAWRCVMSRSVLISALGLQACCQMPEFTGVLFWGVEMMETVWEKQGSLWVFFLSLTAVWTLI